MYGFSFILSLVLGLMMFASEALMAQRTARPPGPREAIHVNPYERPGIQSNRIVLVEAETWVDCAPACRLRDIVLDAVLHRYSRRDVVVLSHHYGPPFLPAYEVSDRNGLYLSRRQYYELVSNVNTKATGGCSSIYIDGRCLSWSGKQWDSPPQMLYDSTIALIDRRIISAGNAQLVLETSYSDNIVKVRLHVDSIPSLLPIRAHIILVEDSLTFVGANGMPLHRMVWRAAGGMPDQNNGFSVIVGQNTIIDTQFNLTALSRDIRQRNEAAGIKSGEVGINDKLGTLFPSTIFSLVPQRLAIVAFVQNYETGEVLQAIYRPVI